MACQVRHLQVSDGLYPIHVILSEYDDIFAEPQGLPPQRTRDHRIRLLLGTAPVVVRPYRYPALQKDELKRQCRTMEAQGIIRRSSSAFSSPVVLIKKADGSWRFHVDYRALNERTVKEKFPIPIVDELHGVVLFTKMDIRSGYYQVRMHPDDVHMTAFRTHDDLYEFLVMPFGLTNAPVTFQALMNDILRPFLREFVLVFFDDILVYSSSWSQHLRHLHAVFDVLCLHQLFIKHSKCSFATASVVYLGHIVSAAASMEMDEAKI